MNHELLKERNRVLLLPFIFNICHIGSHTQKTGQFIHVLFVNDFRGAEWAFDCTFAERFLGIPQVGPSDGSEALHVEEAHKPAILPTEEVWCNIGTCYGGQEMWSCF